MSDLDNNKAGEKEVSADTKPQYDGGEPAEGEVFENADHLHRRLGNRQIQLIAIGGSIGTVCCAALLGRASNK